MVLCHINNLPIFVAASLRKRPLDSCLESPKISSVKTDAAVCASSASLYCFLVLYLLYYFICCCSYIDKPSLYSCCTLFCFIAAPVFLAAILLLVVIS
jgi:hypothetical protein